MNVTDMLPPDRIDPSTIAEGIRQEALLTGLFSKVPEAIVLLDTADRVLKVNPEFTKIFGYAQEEACGRFINELVVPEELSAEAEEYTRRGLRGDSLNVETVRKHKDGKRVHVSMISGAVSVADSHISHYAIYRDITERKRAEQRLRESEAYLAEAQRLSQTGSWAWNPATDEIRYCSEMCCHVLGFDHTASRPRFEELFQRLHPDDQAASRERFEKGIRDKADFEWDYRIVHPEKGIRDIHVVGRAVLDGSSNLAEFVGTVIDVTERKRRDQELRQSEAELRTITDTIRQPIGVEAPDGTQLYANRVALDNSGLTLEEVIKEGTIRRENGFLARLCHPDDINWVREERLIGLLEGVPFDLETRLLHKSGQYRWYLVQYNPLKNESGQIIRWYNTATDIDDRKRAEDRLRQSEKELRAITDSIRQFIVVLAPDGTTLYANKLALENVGFTIPDLTNESLLTGAALPGQAEAPGELAWNQVWRKSAHPDDLNRIQAERQEGFLRGVAFEMESRLLFKTGQYRWQLFQYNPLKDESGQIIRWYVTATDIDDRKRAENVRLEERTRIAQELHDTLLQTVQGASMILDATLFGMTEDSPVKKRLDRIVHLMSQGIEEGRNAIQGLRSSDPRGSEDLIVALSGIRHELQISPDIDFRVIVTGRQNQLATQIRNEIYRIGREALVNAFTHSGAKRVELELEYLDNELCMRIRDNGCGMDPQVVEQGRDGHWGLAGMRERATRVGGFVKVLSSPTAGTEVQFSIPISSALEH
jgi:PAS domain S-box-containing protein